MLSAVTPVSDASFAPPLLLPPPLFPPPQAARVEATVAAARMVTRRRVDLGNCSPLCGPGVTARRCGGKGRWGISARAGAGPRPACPEPEQPQPDGPDEAGRGEDHHDHQHDAVDERR